MSLDRLHDECDRLPIDTIQNELLHHFDTEKIAIRVFGFVGASVAVRRGQPEPVARIVEEGAGVRIADIHGGETPSEIAVPQRDEVLSIGLVSDGDFQRSLNGSRSMEGVCDLLQFPGCNLGQLFRKQELRRRLHPHP